MLKQRSSVASGLVKQYLKDNDVHVRDYDDIVRYLERKSEHEMVVLDPNRVSDTLAAALPFCTQ